MKILSTSVAALAVLLGLATAGFAQATRTWVSGVGDDVNPCSRTAPCKTFAGAISKTAVGGEIDAMDDGGFGAVTIGKSITIDGGGHLASILAAGTNGVNISAGAGVVTLRRLQINGAGTGLIGVNIGTAATHVNIEDSEIFGFGAGTGQAVRVAPIPIGTVNVQISNSRLENNLTSGLFVGDGGQVTIKNSQINGNGTAGVDATGATSAPFVLISNCTLSMNGRGVRTASNATVRITLNDIFLNTVFAWQILGGTIETHQDNRVRGAGSGALTPVSY